MAEMMTLFFYVLIGAMLIKPVFGLLYLIYAAGKPVAEDVAPIPTGSVHPAPERSALVYQMDEEQTYRGADLWNGMKPNDVVMVRYVHNSGDDYRYRIYQLPEVLPNNLPVYIWAIQQALVVGLEIEPPDEFEHGVQRYLGGMDIRLREETMQVPANPRGSRNLRLRR